MILLTLNLPPKTIASNITRCYALRWAVAEEADAYFITVSTLHGMKFAVFANSTAKAEISSRIKGTVASLYFKTTFKLCSRDVLMVDARFCRALQTNRQIIHRAALPHASQAQ